VTRSLAQYLRPAMAEDETFRTELLYSYKLNPQTALYVGYADSGLANDVVPDFGRTGRTVFAKLSYAWLR
jgi:hypothetical protein